MNIDILQSVSTYLDFVDKMKLCQLDKNTDNKFLIYDLYDIPLYLKKKLTQNIIKQKKFSKLARLDASNNPKIKDVNDFHHSLVELNCNYNCGIDQNGIRDLKNLKKIYLSLTSKIYNIDHLPNVQVIFDYRVFSTQVIKQNN